MIASSDPRVRLGGLIFFIVFIVLTFASFRRERPFFTPQHKFAATGERPSWLIWTSSAVHLRQRREIIRSTWQTLYKDVPFEARFVVGNPGPEWLPLLEQENETYGDMIMLESASGDDRRFATTHKPLEFWKYLLKQEKSTGQKYDFVSKIDDDSFLDARTFYREFLQPRVEVNHTLIARRCKSGIYWPAGMFYTLTWDLLEVVTKQYERDPFPLEHEDWPLGKMLHDAPEDYDFVNLDEKRAFDVVREGMVTKASILPHKMKKDEEYMWVAAMFNKKGFRGNKLGNINIEDKIREFASEGQQPNGWKCEGD